jgi:tetratricopeptide (TPR) repeat protein
VRAHNGVGAVASRQGDYKPALDQLNAALATAQAKLALTHPEVARSYQEIGIVYVSTGRPREALELFRKALEPLDGRKARRVTDFQELILADFAFSPDGKSLAYSRGPRTRDALLVKGFR